MFLEKIEKFKLSKQFKYYFFGMLCILFPLVITIYGIVYFGGLWDPLGKLKNLKVSIINNDEGCPVSKNILCLVLASQMPEIATTNLGNIVVQNIKTNEQTKGIFDWQNDKLSLEKTKKIVEDYDRWGAIYIPEDFTQNIISQIDKTAFSSPEAQSMIMANITSSLHMTQAQLQQAFDLKKLSESYPASISYIYDTARSYTSVTFIVTVFETIDKVLKKQIALGMYQKTVGKTKFSNDFYLNAYESKYVDIHPINNFGQNFASFMLFVIMFIAAIATNLVYRKYRPFNNYIQSKKTNKSILISALSKIGINMLYMLIVSAFMMLVMFMFGNAQHEKNLFCIYLVFVLWGFLSLTYCQVVSNLLPLLPFLGICVVSIVIQLATCGGIIAVPLQPGFWNIGKAFPMYYATAEMKYLLFNTGGRFSGRNILALLLWAVALAILDVITCIFQLRNVRKAAPESTDKDLEKQAMSEANNNRVTQQDIENNTTDI